MRPEVLAADDHAADAGVDRSSVPEQRQVRRRQLDDIDRVVADHVHQRGVRVPVRLCVDDERAAGDERQEQARDRQVEGKRREQRKGQTIASDVHRAPPIRGSRPGRRARPRTPFGAPGRSGRVDDVREIVETRWRPADEPARRAVSRSCRVGLSQAGGRRPLADGGRWTRTRVAPQSSRMWRIRSGGYGASSGTYAPRASSTARIAITASIDRFMSTATGSPGCTPVSHELRRPPLRTRAQLAERHLARALSHGDAVGRAQSPASRRARATGRGRERLGAGVVEPHQQRLTLVVREDVDVRDRAVRILEQRREQAARSARPRAAAAPAERPLRSSRSAGCNGPTRRSRAPAGGARARCRSRPEWSHSDVTGTPAKLPDACRKRS